MDLHIIKWVTNSKSAPMIIILFLFSALKSFFCTYLLYSFLSTSSTFLKNKYNSVSIFQTIPMLLMQFLCYLWVLSMGSPYSKSHLFSLSFHLLLVGSSEDEDNSQKAEACSRDWQHLHVCFSLGLEQGVHCTPHNDHHS